MISFLCFKKFKNLLRLGKKCKVALIFFANPFVLLMNKEKQILLGRKRTAYLPTRPESQSPNENIYELSRLCVPKRH